MIYDACTHVCCYWCALQNRESKVCHVNNCKKIWNKTCVDYQYFTIQRKFSKAMQSPITASGSSLKEIPSLSSTAVNSKSKLLAKALQKSESSKFETKNNNKKRSCCWLC